MLYPEKRPHGGRLAAAIQKHGVNTLFLTTALQRRVDEDPSLLQGVQQLYVGGEALSVPHVRRLLEARPEIELRNMYGPSEGRRPLPPAPPPAHSPGRAHGAIGRPMCETRLTCSTTGCSPYR